MDTIIIADSCSDLPESYIAENKFISYLSLIYEISGEENLDDFGKSISYSEFYKRLREGETSKTSQINVQRFYDEFKKDVENNKTVIYIGFSSVLSGCVNSANVAREQILEDYKEADITVIDSKSASLGCGLLVYYASEMLKAGAKNEEIIKWIEENKLKLNHWFTVEDLNHLKRGGRISSTAAIVGTLLNIKPVLKVDDEGRLIPDHKAKGRKKSLKNLVEELDSRIVNEEAQVIAISHGDSLEDAEYVKKLILEKHKVKDIIINYVGPVIGSHSGPGTIALFFLGNKR